jgi:hypothetical protein
VAIRRRGVHEFEGSHREMFSMNVPPAQEPRLRLARGLALPHRTFENPPLPHGGLWAKPLYG